MEIVRSHVSYGIEESLHDSPNMAAWRLKEKRQTENNMAENNWEWEDKDGICVMGRSEEHG